MIRSTTVRVAALALFLQQFVSVSAAQPYPPCSQSHPGREHRAESLLKNGDSKMAYSAGGHAVLYAVERYGLKQFVSSAETNAAFDKMYDFLKWKMYSPAAVASTWLGAGYQHFDKAYVDEGAAMLLGILVPSSGKPLLNIPKWLSDHIILVAGEGASQAAVEEVLKQAGLPSPFAHDVATQLIEHAVGQGIQAVQTVASLAIPRDFDIDNRFVELAVAAKKNEKQGNGGQLGGGRRTGSSAPAGADAAGARVPGSGGTAANSSDMAALQARIAQLEARVAQLEKQVEASRTQGAQPNSAAGRETVKGAESLQPTDTGYPFVGAYVRLFKGASVSIKVNGVIVGSYDGSTEVDLNPYLKPGRLNKVTFDFADKTEDGEAVLRYRMEPKAFWKDIFKFKPLKETTKSFDVPFKP